MDNFLNAWARARNIWKAIRHPSEEEMARRDIQQINQTEHRPGTSGSQADRGFDQNASAMLEEFRLLVGIKQHPSFRAPHGFRTGQRPVVSMSKRSAPNMGIYTHIIDQEVKCGKNYKFFTRLINVCLGAQLVVAAALTAIGAANGNHSAVTAFGAINTILAGVMTYLKGSGLPNRIKYFQHEWTGLREYIEQRERDIVCGYQIDVQEEVEKIRRMYEAIKMDIEANTPDRFVSNARAGGAGATNHVSSMATPAITPSRTPSMMKLGSDADSDAIRQSYLHGAGIQKPKNAVIDRVTEIGDLEKRMEAESQDYIADRRRDLANTAAHTRSAAQDSFTRATSYGSNTVHDNLARAFSFGSTAAAGATHAAHDQAARAASFGSHLMDDVTGLRTRLHNKLREVGDLEKEIEHRSSSFVSSRREAAGQLAGQVSQAGHDAQANVARAAAENEAAARESLARSAEAANAAIAQRQEAARRALEDEADAARGFAHETIDRSFEVGTTPVAVAEKGEKSPTVEDEKK